MYSQKFVFLQHGVIKDDLSRWLNRFNKNIDIFVVSTQKEYESVLECNYGYTEKQFKLTGLPRYDYLYDDSNNKNVITIMPTWRQYLVGNYDLLNDTRVVLDNFDKTAYCLMYKRLFNDSRLFRALKENGYEIQLMLHPAMPRECITYFGISDEVKILNLNTCYRDIYAMSKMVITDYSSAVFDFAYLKKPILYYQADKDEFFSGKHIYDKGYFDYETDGFGEVAYDVEKLVDLIIEYINNGCVLKEKYLKRINNTFYYHDKNNCARVYEQLLRLN
jgi:CDP-glycerol glycerophosphotransferase (TagB/SpsB family)